MSFAHPVKHNQPKHTGHIKSKRQRKVSSRCDARVSARRDQSRAFGNVHTKARHLRATRRDECEQNYARKHSLDDSLEKV